MALESTCQSGISKQLCKESNDIISNLPQQITECILMRLPYDHAVRMSILSRYWRYKWVMLPNIILDQKFFEYVLKRFENRICEASQAYSDIISNILLRHIGPIDKFVLCIPSWFHLKADLSQWLQFIARHGIKEFTLANNHHVRSPKLKLPSCLYSFENLRVLEIYNCHDLNLPPTFKGFPHLKVMDLDLSHTVLVGALEAQTLENLISLCSRLEHLKLNIKVMRANLSICAPNLQELVVKGILSSLSLKETRNIKVIAMDVKLLQDAGLKRSMNEFFGSLLRCQKLVLDEQFCVPMLSCHFIHDFVPPKKLVKELEALQTLRIMEVPLNCNYAVHFILCLLRSSPNLQRLFINVVSFKKCSPKSVQNKGNFTLPCLKYAEFGFNFMKSMELKLITLVLACSPALKVMTIMLNGPFLDEEKMQLESELMRQGRASPMAEIIVL